MVFFLGRCPPLYRAGNTLKPEKNCFKYIYVHHNSERAPLEMTYISFSLKVICDGANAKKRGGGGGGGEGCCTFLHYGARKN